MTAYDVEAVLQEQGYDSDSLLDELVYQVSNTGVEYEYHDEFYRMGFVGGIGGWTAEEILSECERHDIDLEEYKLEEEDQYNNSTKGIAMNLEMKLVREDGSLAEEEARLVQHIMKTPIGVRLTTPRAIKIVEHILKEWEMPKAK